MGPKFAKDKETKQERLIESGYTFNLEPPIGGDAEKLLGNRTLAKLLPFFPEWERLAPGLQDEIVYALCSSSRIRRLRKIRASGGDSMRRRRKG